MARIKRVFVEGIDVGGEVAGALIKQTNRLVEAEGLDVSSTAREKILSDLLSPGKYARLLVYMNHSDITGTYSQTGGVKKFVDEALATQADVTEALAFLAGGLKDTKAWLQRPDLVNNRMPIGQLKGPEDSVVVLNVPKAALTFAKPKTKEEAAEVLQKLLSHNYFVAHLSVPQAKKGLPDVNAKTVEELLDHFNFAAITGYKIPADRQAAVAEWKEAQERKSAAGEQKRAETGALESPAHEFADWIEEYRLQHRLPKTEEAALAFFFKAKAKLDELSGGNAKLRRNIREAGTKLVKPDSGLWDKLAMGDIEGYMKVIRARAEAAGEEQPKTAGEEQPKTAGEEQPKTDKSVKQKDAADASQQAAPEKPAQQEMPKSQEATSADLPKTLQTTAADVADRIKRLPAWDPKHQGSLLAAIERALAAG